MARVNIPSAPDQITPQWLTQALRQTGAIRDAGVVSLDSEAIAQGVGLIGELVRIRPQYDREEPGAPVSLIGKFPAAIPENREIGNLFRFYEREIRFYEEIAHEVDLRIPRCYHGAMDTEAGDYVLLLEDLSPAEIGDQLVSPTAAQAELATRELAKFHAAWWQSPRLSDIEWMPYVNDPINKSAEDSYKDAWQPFLDKFGAKLEPWAVETGERLIDNISPILDRFAEPPCTIIHGDYRMDNLFFDGPLGPDSLAVIDWQIAGRGRGAFDIAYFMATNVDPPVRKATEMDALKSYHRILLERGVDGYNFDRLLLDYRQAVLFCLVYAVISGGALDLSNERGVSLVTAMMTRTFSAIQDLEAAELFLR